ncbi:MAG: DUF563 domain-containing protein [Magnetococcales bacterium]|nr:DUF563 domain-containing protein [Magnetococcales bacterium]
MDSQEDIPQLVDFVERPEHDPEMLFQVMTRLLGGGRLRSAYLLSMLLANKGLHNPTLDVLLVAGGLLFDNPQEVERGMAALRLQVGDLSPEERLHTFEQAACPALTPLLRAPLTTAIQEGMPHLCALLALLLPSLEQRFAWQAPLPAAPLPTMAARAQPLLYPHPPGMPPASTRRSVLVVTRTHLYPGHLWPSPSLDVWSYPVDREPRQQAEARLLAALNGCGWQAELCSVASENQRADWQRVVDACLQRPVDILILDERWLLPQSRGEAAVLSCIEHLSLLRQLRPALKVLLTLLEVASIPAEDLQEVAPFLHLIWGCTAPDHPLWQQPALADKVLHLPLPPAEVEQTPLPPLDAALSFDEHLSGYRRFWLAAAQALGVPVITREALRYPPGLPPLQRYALYRQHLARTPCSLRLALRPQQPCPVSDRSFATLLSGALLVQEGPSELSRYFIPGTHYLEFTSLAELASICRLISEHPQEAEEIRRCGQQFAQEHYSAARLIGHLEARLYAPEHNRTAPTAAVEPAEQRHQFVSFEYISVKNWCRPVSPEGLVSQSGPLICHFEELLPNQPPIDLGLHLRGKGYEDLFPCSEENIGAFAPRFDFRSGAVVPRAPFIARLENVHLEYPGFGLFLDRHLLMEESYHQKDTTSDVMNWYRDNGKRRVATLEIHATMGTDWISPTYPLCRSVELNYYIERGICQYEEGPILLISGPSSANWHHWLIEMLPRLWAVQAVPALAELPLLLRGPLKPFQAETLQAMGVTPERIRLFTGESVRIKTLFFPSYIAHLNYAAQNVAWLRNNLLPAFAIQTEQPAHNRIYLSRKQASRSIINEEAVEAALHSRGFQSVCMEEKSVREQLQILNGARMIVTPHGAGATGILFCQPGATLIELMPTSYRHLINMSYASYNQCHYGCLICADGGPTQLEILVDIDALLRVVDTVLASGLVA